MTIREEVRDLFQTEQGYYLCHCISKDFRLGAGIALQFDDKYNMRRKLREFYGEDFYGGYEALPVDNVFNLVTKDKCYHKPTYESLKAALEDMKEQMQQEFITKLAMPRIGCGLDGLEWDKVRAIVEEVFADTDVEILVCSL